MNIATVPILQSRTCEYHMQDSDKVAKRFQDFWTVLHSSHAHTRAHYRRLYMDAYHDLRKSIETCDECRKLNGVAA